MKLLNIKITRRTVQIGLGSLWLFDSLLQLQRQMFTSNFANQVIANAAQGQPHIVSGPMHFFVHIFLYNPVLFNSFTVITQLALGILILNKRTTRLGLIFSIGWGLFVWYIGEGFGGIFGLHTLILMGAPGAALIYAILALAVMPPKPEPKTKTDNSPAYWLAFVWAFLWIGGAIYQLFSWQNNVSAISSMLSNNSNNMPGWLASLDIHLSNVINGFGNGANSPSAMHMSATQMTQMQPQQYAGFWFILLLAMLQAVIGIAVLFPGYIRKIAIGLGIILSLIFWVVGQSFGGIFTGLSTDPNSGPLFILLGIAILSCPNIDQKISKFIDHLESMLT